MLISWTAVSQSKARPCQSWWAVFAKPLEMHQQQYVKNQPDHLMLAWPGFSYRNSQIQ